MLTQVRPKDLNLFVDLAAKRAAPVLVAPGSPAVAVDRPPER
jgi:hypothetical protein